MGDIESNARNDVTTYNNLLRLYLGISKQRLTSKVVIDRDLIYRRISGEEIVSYGIFVVDKDKRGANFFLLEEIRDEFYVNPRNAMFQVKYKPLIGKPIDHYSFCTKLIDAVLESLNRSLEAIETELLVISNLKEQLMKIKSHE